MTRPGHRSALWPLPGDPPVMIKRAAPDRVAREAAALERVAPLGLAPRLVAAGGDVLVTTRLPGRSRELASLRPGALRALGAAVRRVHDLERSATGGWTHWPGRVRSTAAYRARYAAEAEAAARPAGRADLAAAVLGALPPLPADEPRPFRLLHGDLWGGNVLWHRGAPRLIDWEDARAGDPAEELAYLGEMDALPDRALGHVLAGYGAPAMAERVGAWRALVALSAGLWFLAEGRPGPARTLLAQARERSSAPRRAGPPER